MGCKASRKFCWVKWIDFGFPLGCTKFECRWFMGHSMNTRNHLHTLSVQTKNKANLCRAPSVWISISKRCCCKKGNTMKCNRARLCGFQTIFITISMINNDDEYFWIFRSFRLSACHVLLWHWTVQLIFDFDVDYIFTFHPVAEQEAQLKKIKWKRSNVIFFERLLINFWYSKLQ